MPVRFLYAQSRGARAALIAALLIPPCAASTAAARWSAPARPAGCTAALPSTSAPSVVFPGANPTTRSGPGALLWSAPRGCVVGAAAIEAVGAAAGKAVGTAAGEAVGAPLGDDDLPGRDRALAAGADAGNLAEVVAAAGTATGQVLAVGGGDLAEGDSVGTFGAPRSLGGPATPVALASAYLGDVAIASPVRIRGSGWAIAVRVQRHYAESPAAARLVPVGASPVEAVAAAMDYRAEVLLVWASGGAVYARALSPAGALGPVRRLGSFAAGSLNLELRALLSDDGHAIVAWRSQSAAPDGAPRTTIELSISGSGLAFGAPRVLERFRDLGGFVPPAGSLRLPRLSSEAVMIAWTGVDAGRYVVRASPVSLHRGAWAPVVISGGGPATDAVLADLAAGPDAEAFALWRTAPSLADGAPGPAGSASWTIRAARGHYAGRGEVSFAAPELVAAPGPNGPPAVAVDPTSGRVLAAWVTLAGGSGVGRIMYALRAAGSRSAPAPAAASSTHAARRVLGGHGGVALIVGLCLLAVLVLAGALLFAVSRRPEYVRARRG